jgi:hypothetical protein
MKAWVRPGKNSGRVRDAVRRAEGAEVNPIDFRCGTYYCKSWRNSSQVMQGAQRSNGIRIAKASIVSPGPFFGGRIRRHASIQNKISRFSLGTRY